MFPNRYLYVMKDDNVEIMPFNCECVLRTVCGNLWQSMIGHMFLCQGAKNKTATSGPYLALLATPFSGVQ